MASLVLHQFGDHSAIRLGAGGSLSSTSREVHLTTGGGPDDVEDSSGHLSLLLQYLRYVSPSKRLSMYWAVGPDVEYMKGNTASGSHEEDRSVSSLGVRATLGVEWSPAERLGLHAEYGVTGSWTRLRRRDSVDAQAMTTEETSWDLAARGVLFGLSAYF